MPNVLVVNSVSPPTSLKEFVLYKKENRHQLILSIVLIFIQVVIFKIIYPYPNFLIGDSWTYIFDANENLQLSSHPIGYGKFLRLFSVLTISDTALVIFQFLLLQASALSLNFSLYYFYSPPRLIKMLLWSVILLNPILFYISNTISSDNLFFSLGIIWITLLLWIIYQPTPAAYYWHAIILFLAFIVRFNAMFFPIISLLAFYLSKSSLILKVKGGIVAVVLIGSFIIYNREKYFELCGIRQLAPFSGWQMASNGLFAYKFVHDEARKEVPVKFKSLDTLARNYYSDFSKESHNIRRGEALDRLMWGQNSPLWIYYWRNFADKEDREKPDNWGIEPFRIKNWAKVAPLYKDYGTWLIIHYPRQFFLEVIIPNIKAWFVPPMVQLQRYNSGYSDIADNVVLWFKYKKNHISTRNVNIKAIDKFYGLYPLWSGFVNITFFLLSICFLLKWKQFRSSYVIGGIMMAVFFWIINFGFNVFASPIELRYVLLPIHIVTVFSITMIGVLFTKNAP